MNTKYIPGKLYKATVEDIPGQIVFTDGKNDGARWWDLHVICHSDLRVTDVTGPLTVLDLDLSDWSVTISDVVNALRQHKPPRIDEPGLWGVVESSATVTERQSMWVKRFDTGCQDWFNDNGVAVDWADLVNPILIRPGIKVQL